MKKYKKYKDSGIEWIGEIPEHWEVKRVATLGIFSKGKGIPRSELKDNGCPAILYGDIYTKYNIKTNFIFNHISEKTAESSIQIQSGDILFTGSGETVEDIGKNITYIGNKSVYVGGDVIILRQKKCDSLFLSYSLNSNSSTFQKARTAKGQIIIHIYSSNLREIILPLPLKSEQTTIANYLDRKTAELEKLITQKESLLKLYKEEKTAIINQAVTKGINPDVKLKDSGIDCLGDIPEHWEVKKLKYVGKTKYGLGQPPKLKFDGLPLIRATNIFSGRIDDKDMIFVDPNDIPYDRDPVLKEFDIIVVRSGAYTADSAIIPKKYEGAITGYDMVFRSDYNYNSKFISFVLLSNYVLNNQLILQSLRAAQPHLNREELGETLILIPQIEEQTQIVQHIETETARINAKEEKTKKLIELLKEYKTALISEVVTGKIKVI